MTTIPQLPELAAATDDDLLVIYDIGLGMAYKVTRGTLLDGLARLQGDVEFSAVSADSASFTEVTAALLSFAAGGALANAATVQASITIPALAAGATAMITMPVPGLALGMGVHLALVEEPPAGVIATAWASAAGTATIRFRNLGTAGTTATAMPAQIVALQVG